MNIVVYEYKDECPTFFSKRKLVLSRLCYNSVVIFMSHFMCGVRG